MTAKLILAGLVVLAALVMPATAEEVDDIRLQDEITLYQMLGIPVDPKDEVLAISRLSEAGIGSLIDALKHEDLWVRYYAAWYLGDHANFKEVDPLILSAVDPLIEALKHDYYWGVRVQSAIALGKIGDTRAVDPLIEALNNKKPGVRFGAAEALGEIGDTRAVGPLTVASRDRIPWSERRRPKR